MDEIPNFHTSSALATVECVLVLPDVPNFIPVRLPSVEFQVPSCLSTFCRAVVGINFTDDRSDDEGEDNNE